MAAASDLPCDGDGICMVCKAKPSNEESLTCNTCATPWHVTCLSSRPETMADALKWVCPDCSSLSKPNPVAHHHSSDLVAAIRAIESDTSLTEREKAKRRQRLMCKRDEAGPSSEPDADAQGGPSNPNDLLDLLGGNLNCSICMQLPERPITTPCGHNFCLKCFQKWTGQGKRSCANCRRSIPSRVASNPRINSALVVAIRMAKASKSNADVGQAKTYHFVRNQNRPDKAFTTERAKKSGKANACCGKIFVTSAPDHFGPILAENDPERNQGVLVGESWEDRMECRQWGIHLPHVAGIAGQSSYGSQSVALSGGYEDDEDHGEWFLYTGSGGRDLSGNKRTNKNHSFDQKFEKLNEALRVSCRKGYPVRVVRSHKEKRSAYAPETGVRYDGIYRIEKCWRKKGGQGYIVCRYLFVRCDNEPAPWTSNDHGDLPRPLPVIPELKKAMDLTERKESPSWDYDEETGRWMWKKPPPPSRKRVHDDYSGNGKERRRSNKAHKMSARERLLKEFSCYICRKVMTLPLTTPCAHNFCKACLESAFAGQSAVRQRTCQGRRTLRSQKNIMKCPCCSNDIAEFLQNPQVNRELMSVIESLKHKDVESEENEESNSVEDTHEEGDINDEDEQDDEDDEEADEEEEGEENCYEEGEEKENTLKPETDVNLQETGKQKKATSGSPLTDVKTTSLEQPNAPNNEKTDSRVKPGSAEVEEPQAPPKESKVKTQNQKRKKAEDGGNVAPLGVGATIRSKRAKTAAAK